MKYEITIMCQVIAAHEINKQKFDEETGIENLDKQTHTLKDTKSA